MPVGKPLHFRSLEDESSVLNVEHFERAEYEELVDCERLVLELKVYMIKSLCAWMVAYISPHFTYQKNILALIFLVLLNFRTSVLFLSNWGLASMLIMCLDYAPTPLCILLRLIYLLKEKRRKQFQNHQKVKYITHKHRFS
jgi:hypothetical protein